MGYPYGALILRLLAEHRQKSETNLDKEVDTWAGVFENRRPHYYSSV